MKEINRTLLSLLSLVFPIAQLAQADAPVALYVFPAGGQRGKSVDVKVGGLNLHQSCNFEMLGDGVTASKRLTRTETVWFEGPRIPLPDSQRKEDYPKDMAGVVKIAADAQLGVRHWRAWTSQGATPALEFVVGDLPEIVEREIDGEPVPVAVTLPVTINGRIFPREDVDVWTIDARKGQSITCLVRAARLGSPLDARIEVLDPRGRRLAENDDRNGSDPMVRFVAPVDGVYQARIHDVQFLGSQAHVYRLTITSGPVVESVFPLGGGRGEAVRLDVAGQAVPRSVSIAIPKDAPSTHAARIAVGNSKSIPFLLDVDDLPEHRESLVGDKPLSLPAVCNGRIAEPGEIDEWIVNLTKGEAWELDLRAVRLGSPLFAKLSVTDDAGKVIAKAETIGQDPQLQLKPPRDGKYLIRVAARFRRDAGPTHAYRLRIAKPAAPGFRLTLATDAISLERGKTAKLRVSVERLHGFKEAIELTLRDLPKGVTVKPTTIAAKKKFVDLILQADEKAPIKAVRVKVIGNAKIGEADDARTATLATPRGEPVLDHVLLDVAMPTPFKVVGDYVVRLVPCGTVYRRRYRIERNGYDGPLTIQMADRQIRHLQGVTGPTLTLPPGRSTFDYPLHLPTWMELGRTCRAVVTAVGVIKDEEGTEHVVNFSSSTANDQIIAIIEPGPLSIDVNRRTIVARSGTSVNLHVEIKRGPGVKGIAQLELLTASHVKGVSAKPVSIPASATRATFTVDFAKRLAGPLNCPIVIRATVLKDKSPVSAEVKISPVLR